MKPWDAAARAWTAFAALVAGFALARAAGPEVPAWVWLAASGVCAMIAMWIRGRACGALLLGAVLAFGGAWWSIRVGAPAQAEAGLHGARMIVVEGVVTDGVRAVDPGEGARPGLGTISAFTVRTEGGRFRVRATGRVEAFAPGDRVRIEGAWSPVGAPSNPGERDLRTRATQEGLLGRLETSGGLIERVAGDQGVSLSARVARLGRLLRARALGAFGAEGDGRTGQGDRRGLALARSLLLGEDEAALAPAREAFTRVGLSHVLAISGFHLVVLVWSVTMAVRLLGDRGGLESVVVAALVGVYLLIVPAEAPIVRAGAMAICFLLADALGRRHDRLAMLAWIGCGLLLWRPTDAFGLGFQLSVGLTAVLLWMGTRMDERLWGVRLRGRVTTPDPTVWSWIVGGFRSLVSASALCWLVGLPLIAWHTGSVSLLAIPATLVVVPLCVALMWLGFLAILAGVVWPRAGWALSEPIEALGAWTTDVVLWFDESGVSLVRVGPFSVLLAAAGVGLALWWCASGRWRSAGHWLATALVLGWAGFELRVASALGPDVLARIDTLAVGDGTCHIVRSGADALLWDCGSLTRTDVGARTLPRAARALGVTRISLAVLTHPNLDHYNGLLDAARTMGLRTLLVGDATLDHVMSSRDTRLGLMLGELERRGVEIRRVGAGDTVAFGDVEIRFLWPPEGFVSGAANERSLAAAFVERGAGLDSAAILLTGDVQSDAIGGLMELYPELRTGAMEMPHHGSMIRAAVDLLYHTGAKAVHQSTGERRAMDARMEVWREAHEASGGSWGITARDGWVWSEISRNGEVRGGSMRE